MRRRADKVDAAQRDIVAALRQIPGVSVDLGHDDILVGYRGVTYWYEVKSSRAVSARTGRVRTKAKTESQKRLDETWRGHRRYVSNLDEVLDDIKKNPAK